MASVASGERAVQIEDVGFGYRTGEWVVRHCTLDVAPGRVLAVLGPNGRGKTTLLKLLAGTLVPDEGRVTRRAPVAFLPQSLAVPFAYSVFEMVLMGRARHVGALSVPTKADEAIARDAIARLNLTAQASRPFDRLSGGERQLVLFARALTTQARILVLDEPASGLDLRNQGVILRWIQRLAHDGLTVIFTTHQPQHAYTVADDVLLMGEGHRYTGGEATLTLTEENLRDLFGIELRRVQVDAGGQRTTGVIPIWPA